MSITKRRLELKTWEALEHLVLEDSRTIFENFFNYEEWVALKRPVDVSDMFAPCLPDVQTELFVERLS